MPAESLWRLQSEFVQCRWKYDVLAGRQQKNTAIANQLMESAQFQPLSTREGLIFDELLRENELIDKYLRQIDAESSKLLEAIDLIAIDDLAKQEQAKRDKPTHTRKPTYAKRRTAPVNTRTTKKIRQRWRDWGSVIENHVALAVPIIEVEEIEKTESHTLEAETDKRARAILAWAPWARRRRYSRRYEGFDPGYSYGLVK